MFFVAAALVLTTAGVFAGKAKFVDDPVSNLYYKNGLSYIQVATGATIPTSVFLYNSTGNTARLSSSSGSTFDLYTWNGSAYRVVYNKAF